MEMIKVHLLIIVIPLPLPFNCEIKGKRTLVNIKKIELVQCASIVMSGVDVATLTVPY